MAEGGGSGSGPRDAAVMEAILKEMGVMDYEPNVVHQMLEFSYSKLRSDIIGVFMYIGIYNCVMLSICHVWLICAV